MQKSMVYMKEKKKKKLNEKPRTEWNTTWNTTSRGALESRKKERKKRKKKLTHGQCVDSVITAMLRLSLERDTHVGRPMQALSKQQWHNAANTNSLL